MLSEPKSWIALRALSYLKRITLALESLSAAHGTPTPRPRRHTEFSVATTEALNAKWERDQLNYDEGVEEGGAN